VPLAQDRAAVRLAGADEPFVVAALLVLPVDHVDAEAGQGLVRGEAADEGGAERLVVEPVVGVHGGPVLSRRVIVGIMAERTDRTFSPVRGRRRVPMSDPDIC